MTRSSSPTACRDSKRRKERSTWHLFGAQAGVTHSQTSAWPWLTGTPYPATPEQLYIAFYRSQPKADGSDAAEQECLRVGPIRFSEGQAAASPYPSGRFIEPIAAVELTMPGPALPIIPVHIQAWGILSQESGGTPVYTGTWPNATLHKGHTITVPQATFRVYAEQSH